MVITLEPGIYIAQKNLGVRIEDQVVVTEDTTSRGVTLADAIEVVRAFGAEPVLVLALVDMLEPDWQALTPEQQGQRYEDHSHVNDIIAGTIDSVQQQVVAPDDRWMSLLDWALGPLDEHAAARLIRQWREEVWQHAMEMLAAADLEERDDLRRALATQALERGEQIQAHRLDRFLSDLL